MNVLPAKSNNQLKRFSNSQQNVVSTPLSEELHKREKENNRKDENKRNNSF